MGYVPAEKLHDTVIKTFQPSKKSAEIDPYSSLEEIFSNTDDADEEPVYYMTEYETQHIFDFCIFIIFIYYILMFINLGTVHIGHQAQSGFSQ